MSACIGNRVNLHLFLTILTMLYWQQGKFASILDNSFRKSMVITMICETGKLPKFIENTNILTSKNMELLLTYWGRVTHICISKLTIIGSDNGLSPGRRHAIIWTNAGILSIGPLGGNFSEISIEFHIFSFKKMHFKMTSRKWRPFCLGLNVLNNNIRV